MQWRACMDSWVHGEDEACHALQQQTCDAWLLQNKELMLSKLRTELCISDERHEELRQRLDSGEERPWVKCVPLPYHLNC